MTLPLARWSDFTYAGAFRLPQTDKENTGRFYPNRGGISVASNPALMYVQGFMANGNIAWGEVEIPLLVRDVVSRKELSIARSVGPMLDIEGSVDTHGDKKDRAMHCYEYNGKLIGSLIQQYDASRDNKYFMWVADDSGVHGLYELEGHYKASGWIGETPDEWRDVFGSHYIGHAHTFSIVGRASSGPAAYVEADTSQFYWLYDLNDLVKVKNGELQSHEVLPYEYGPFTTPVTDITWYKGQEGRNPVIGGSFDPSQNRVYISLRSADGNKPVVVAYDINIDTDKPELTLEERVSILEEKVARLEGA